MLKTKITPLYERLSRDDELQGESNSIYHQKEMLDDNALGKLSDARYAALDAQYAKEQERKANGKQKEYEERIKAAKKAEMEAKKTAIRAEDMAKGVFISVGSIPKEEPQKGTAPASVAV